MAWAIRQHACSGALARLSGALIRYGLREVLGRSGANDGDWPIPDIRPSEATFCRSDLSWLRLELGIRASQPVDYETVRRAMWRNGVGVRS